MTPGTDLYKIPFLLGVAGHRDLVSAEKPAIRAAVASLLGRLTTTYPDVPFSLLCSMADGADLLVADAAAELGISIVALLPFAQAICRADLGSGEAQALFDRICATAEIQELPLPQGVTSADVAREGPHRDRQFRQAGALIARYSGLLIAIWDGEDTGHRAGTARVIEYRRSGMFLGDDDDAAGRDALLSVRDGDLIYAIRCSRRSSQGAPPPATTVRVVGFGGPVGGGDERFPVALQTTLDRIADFNRDADRFAGDIHDHGQRLTPATPFPVTDRLVYLDRLFGAADRLSSRYRGYFTRALRARYGLWALMAFLLLAFKKDSVNASGLLTITGVLAVFGLGAVLALWANRRSWQRKYLDYRALAEGLRVDFYWEIAGVRGQFEGEFAHESFLQKQDVDLEWIRCAMRTVSFRLAMRPSGTMETGFDQAFSGWIGDDDAVNGGGQLRFYRQRSQSLERRLHFEERLGRVLLFGGLVLAFVFAIDIALALTSGPTLPPGIRNLMLWALALLTVYAAIFEIYLGEKADRALIRQYRYMYALFAFAADELRTARLFSQRADILRSLGHACLAEHAQWILAHRDKRIEGLRW